MTSINWYWVTEMVTEMVALSDKEQVTYTDIG